VILVTGAAGKTGLAVLSTLGEKGVGVRAFIHTQEQEKLVRQAGAAEVIIGNLLDAKSLERVVKNIEAIYLICPNVHPKEFDICMSFIKAARDAGSKRIVYHSVLFPQIEAMPHHWQKMRVEEALIQSGLEFTILQPASYMQNILPYWDAIKGGEYRVPYSIESVFSPVDLGDVAEVASQVLTNKGHESATYQLAGTERLSSQQMAELMGAYLGKTVIAQFQPSDDWMETAKDRGMDAYAIEALSNMFSYYDRYGFSGSGLMLEHLLGRPATTFTQFLSRLGKR